MHFGKRARAGYQDERCTARMAENTSCAPIGPADVKVSVIVPADGWYDWTGEKGHKQPWYIRLKADKPMFMAGITNWKPYKD